MVILVKKYHIMKKNLFSNFNALLLVAIFFPLISFSQVEVKWTSNFNSNVLWQEVTSLGNLIVSTQNELCGIDIETGQINWSNPTHARLSRAAYRELPNSPFFTVSTDNTLRMADQFTGKEVFNSISAGVADIKDYFLLYNTEKILVAGSDLAKNPVMVAINMSDGSIAWSVNEKFGRIVAVNELENNDLLIVTLFNNYKIKASSGDIVWKEANSEEAKKIGNMGAFGALMQDVAANLTEDVDFNMLFFKEPGQDVFYLASEQESKSSMTSSTGEPNMIYTNNYNAYNLSDGSLVWPTPLEVKGKLSQVAFLENGILVMPDDGNRTMINLFEYKTHEGLWGKKGRGIPIKGGIYDFMDSGNGILLVSHTTNNDFLNFLDPVNGIITFDKPVKVEGSVVGIVPLANSILYITTSSINILDQNTGTLKWSKSIATQPALTAEYDGKIYALDNRTGTIKVIDKATEEVSELSGNGINFEGGEWPTKIEVMEDGIFLSSEQNAAKIGFDGSEKFMAYYPAPREAGWKRALLYAASVRAAYIGASSYYVAGAMASAENDIRKEDAVAGEMVGQIGDAYGELGNAAAGFAGDAFRMANARKKATQSGRDFMFIMSKRDKDILLLKVSKYTGEVDGEILLGKDREPVYAVDDITGQVYYLTGDNEITSYQVK